MMLQWTQPKVLLVDDSWYVQSLVEDLLAADGYDVTAVRNGEEAVDAYRAHPVDVVLMDVVLPGMDGFATCARIQELDPFAQVVFMTGMDDLQTFLQADGAGGTALLRKPVAASQLREAVRYAIERRPQMACELQAAG